MEYDDVSSIPDTMSMVTSQSGLAFDQVSNTDEAADKASQESEEESCPSDVDEEEVDEPDQPHPEHQVGI